MTLIPFRSRARAGAFRRLLPGVVLLALCAGPAAAQTMADLQKACTSDVKALCAGIQPGGGRIRQCMTEKRDQLSSECKAAVGAAAQNAAAAPKN